jgi:hypothetical protein
MAGRHDPEAMRAYPPANPRQRTSNWTTLSIIAQIGDLRFLTFISPQGRMTRAMKRASEEIGAARKTFANHRKHLRVREELSGLPIDRFHVDCPIKETGA